jgi:hypothetical protein
MTNESPISCSTSQFQNLLAPALGDPSTHSESLICAVLAALVRVLIPHHTKYREATPL